MSLEQILSPDIERLGDLAPDEAAKLIHQWADEHAYHGFTDHGRALDGLAVEVAGQDRAIQCVVLRHPSLYATSVASFCVLPRRFSL